MKFILLVFGIAAIGTRALPAADGSQSLAAEQETRTFGEHLGRLPPTQKAKAIVQWWNLHEAEFRPSPTGLAIRFFDEMRDCKEAAVPVLKSAMTNPNPEVRVGASAMLASLYETALPALDELKKGIEDSDWRVRQYSTLAVCNFGCLARTAVPAMIRNLRHDSGMLRGWTVFALGYLDEVAKPAVPALVDMLRHPETFQAGWTPGSAVTAVSRIVWRPFANEKEVLDWWEATGKHDNQPDADREPGRSDHR